MATRRARLGIGHALAWVAYGLAAAALVTDALGRDSGPLALALGAACALAAAALAVGVLGAVAASGARVGATAARSAPTAPATAGGGPADPAPTGPPQTRPTPRTLTIGAAAIAAVAAAAAAALTLLDQPPHLAVAAALGLAAGAQVAAVRTMVAADPALAPRVRPAPTVLAAATGVALVAVAGLVPGLGSATAPPAAADQTIIAVSAHSSMLGVSIALIAAALLQLLVIALAAASSPGAHRPDGAGGPDSASWTRHLGSTSRDEVHEADPLGGIAAPPALLALLAIAVAGLTALAALRPALSAIGADDPQPAGPMALTLALGALLGPPLAMLAERSGGRAAVLATVAGAAALAAPIARPGVLDWVAAAVLGVALAASVALAELARRADQRLATGATALLLLAGAAGAGLAALLLQAVPLPDVVLGAALACLVAGVGVWAPHSASMAHAGDGRRRRRRGDDPEGSSL